MRPRLQLLFCAAALAGLAGCSGSGSPDDGAASADSLTQRQRDSIVGASGLPGSRGVQRGLEASDAAAARAAAMDSISDSR